VFGSVEKDLVVQDQVLFLHFVVDGFGIGPQSGQVRIHLRGKDANEGHLPDWTLGIVFLRKSL
jgi:hypothetical protein